MTVLTPDAGRAEAGAVVTLPTRAARALVLFTTFVCAACGLVYELALITLGSYLIGDSVVQASIVLSTMVFAMGIGALAAKRLQRRAVVAFAAIEATLAVVGGVSVLGLYAAFAWLDLYQPALVATSLLIGTLIGAEIPVLMALIQRIRAQAAADAAADLFAADYVGALVGGLAFPFLLLPRFGQVQGALAVGVVNVVAAGIVSVWVFGGTVSRRARVGIGVVLLGALAVLGVASRSAARLEVSARQALYDAPIVHSDRSAYQEIVLTESKPLVGRGATDVRLFLDGDLQLSSLDEYRYHEALVHPAMAGPHRRVLILGGGDGMAVREVLRHQGVEQVVLVDLDPAVVDLARSDARLRTLNAGALDDPRVTVVSADAFAWLREADDRFDVVVADFPDPDDAATAKLYSVELYSIVAARVLADDGRLVVQAGSPYFAPEAFWCIDATLAAAGWSTRPYQADVPSFGPWGFVLAARDGLPPSLTLGADPPALRYLSPEVLAAADVFPPDRGRSRYRVEPSTLVRPVLLDYARRGWREE